MTPVKITRTPHNHCLACGKPINSASPSLPADRRRKPRPGDISLCLDCGHAHIFTNDLTLREPNAIEAADIAADPDAARARAILADYNRKRTN